MNKQVWFIFSHTHSSNCVRYTILSVLCLIYLHACLYVVEVPEQLPVYKETAAALSHEQSHVYTIGTCSQFAMKLGEIRFCWQCVFYKK